MLLPVWRVNDGSLAVYGTSSPAWKRGPLAPVVVVGEGQVNLVSGRCKAVPWAKSPKLCG